MSEESTAVFLGPDTAPSKKGPRPHPRRRRAFETDARRAAYAPVGATAESHDAAFETSSYTRTPICYVSSPKPSRSGARSPSPMPRSASTVSPTARRPPRNVHITLSCLSAHPGVPARIAPQVGRVYGVSTDRGLEHEADERLLPLPCVVGKAHMQKGNMAKAIEFLTTAVTKDQMMSVGYVTRGCAHFRDNK